MNKREGIIKNELGRFHYEILPQNTRPAVMSDFYHNRQPMIKMPYLIYSYMYDVYDCYRVSAAFPPSDFEEMINDKRVFVFLK